LPELFDREVHCLLGLPFDAIDMLGAIRRIRIAALRREPCFLSTPNLNWVVACLTDVAFRDSVVRSDLSIVDGMPLIWISRLLDIPLRERVPGSGVFETLRSDEGGHLSVFFLGGQTGIAQAACQQLNSAAGSMACVGFECPGFGNVAEMSSDETIAKINDSGADFVVVALGARKGQEWIEHNRHRLAAPIVSHLGAVVDFIAGSASRAPVWTQRAGLEWLWRIKERPSLWRRYFFDGLVLLRLLVTRVIPYAWFIRRNRPGRRALDYASANMEDAEGASRIRIGGAWIEENLGPLRKQFEKAAGNHKNIELSMEASTYVDSAFVGLAMLLHAHQQQQGLQLYFTSVPDHIERVFRFCCAEYLLMTSPIVSPDSPPDISLADRRD